MPVELRYHYVAFVDILGFSGMVKADCEDSESGQLFVDKLAGAHDYVTTLEEDLEGLSVSQFSDSIAVSAPFGTTNFSEFVDVIVKLQSRLLSERILCRGGIAVGKHYSNGNFVFSNALIEAYEIESRQAINPRIVVSPNVIDLACEGGAVPVGVNLVCENEEEWIVDYLGALNEADARNLVGAVTIDNLSDVAAIKSKQMWLVDYFNSRFPEAALPFPSRFSNMGRAE